MPSLDAQIFKFQSEEESVATPRITRWLVVAPPGYRDRQAIIVIGKAEAMAKSRKGCDKAGE